MRPGRTLAGALGGILLALAAGPAPAAPAAAAAPVAPAPAIEVSGTAAFSPNGDGVQDVARIRYTLRRPGPVTVVVRPEDGGDPVLRSRLGRRGAGRHTWVWDGRSREDRPVPDASYAVVVQSGDARGERRVQVDRRFRVALATDPSYGARRRDPVVVYPRTRVVSDEVGLVAEAVERSVEGGRLLVRDPHGRVVARAPLRREGAGRSAAFVARLAWRARRPDGRPLPAGTYDVAVRGTDRAGNPASSRPFSVRVSKRKLQWREESRMVLPVDSRISECGRTLAMGCLDVVYCGVVVPSERFAGGLSLRSAVCSQPYSVSAATSLHRVTVADAVRGVDSYRVGFTGVPTVPGETDPLTLAAGDTVLSSADPAQTPWLTTGPYLDGDEGEGGIFRPLRPSVEWRVTTVGDDSFDVATFDLALRYLAVAD